MVRTHRGRHDRLLKHKVIRVALEIVHEPRHKLPVSVALALGRPWWALWGLVQEVAKLARATFRASPHRGEVDAGLATLLLTPLLLCLRHRLPRGLHLQRQWRDIAFQLAVALFGVGGTPTLIEAALVNSRLLRQDGRTVRSMPSAAWTQKDLVQPGEQLLLQRSQARADLGPEDAPQGGPAILSLGACTGAHAGWSPRSRSLKAGW
mmetsp:Transcript_128187/g.285652  ORF Transcript_128187/g.285652 Transcript_128187/m.285652 type:complete len:207 (+) Transcript_128187:375-995(+)